MSVDERELAGEDIPVAAQAADRLDRCKQIRVRVSELKAEIERLVNEHNNLLGVGVVDDDDIAWALGKPAARL